MVRAYLDMRLYQIGNLVMKQKSGVPIGGGFSSAILEAVLLLAEHNFDLTMPRRPSCCCWPLR